MVAASANSLKYDGRCVGDWLMMKGFDDNVQMDDLLLCSLMIIAGSYKKAETNVPKTCSSSARIDLRLPFSNDDEWTHHILELQ